MTWSDPPKERSGEGGAPSSRPSLLGKGGAATENDFKPKQNNETIPIFIDLRGCGDGRLYGGAARFRHDACGAACAGGAVRRPDQPAGEHRRGASRRCDRVGASRQLAGGLKYALDLKVYAVECDIYATADNRVIVAHATPGLSRERAQAVGAYLRRIVRRGDAVERRTASAAGRFSGRGDARRNVETVARREEHPRRRFVGGLYGLLGAFVPAGLSGD